MEAKTPSIMLEVAHILTEMGSHGGELISEGDMLLVISRSQIGVIVVPVDFEVLK